MTRFNFEEIMEQPITLIFYLASYQIEQDKIEEKKRKQQMLKYGRH